VNTPPSSSATRHRHRCHPAAWATTGNTGARRCYQSVRSTRRLWVVATVGCALAGLAAVAPAADLSIRFTGATAGKLEVDHRGQLTSAGSKPLRAAFAVLLLTPDGSISEGDLTKAREAAEMIANMLRMAARSKYGTDVPLTHEVVVTSGASVAPHRERLRNANFTFVNSVPVPGTDQPLTVENYGLKEFAPADILGEAVATIALVAKPAITAAGNMKLNLTGEVTAVKIVSRTGGADEPALDEALQRFRAETTKQIAPLLMPYNVRPWIVPERDRKRIVLGVRPLKKTIPVVVFGEALRVHVTIEAQLQFAAPPVTDADWIVDS
jgi:hypothetical protein